MKKSKSNVPVNLDDRRDWIFEDEDDKRKVSQRINQCYEYIIGYNPMTLLNKIVVFELPEEIESNNTNGYVFKPKDRPFVALKPQGIVSESPDDATLWMLRFPEIFIKGSIFNSLNERLCTNCAIKLFAIQSHYVSWGYEGCNVGLSWQVFLRYENIEFYAEYLFAEIIG